MLLYEKKENKCKMHNRNNETVSWIYVSSKILEDMKLDVKIYAMIPGIYKLYCFIF